MSKAKDYLKHFFLLSTSRTRNVQNYKDYTGRYFTKYKESVYFLEGSLVGNTPTLYKSEVAAFSEMTKVTLLIAMGLVVYLDIVCWAFFVKAMVVSVGGEWLLTIVLGLPLCIYISLLALMCVPRTVFIVKNFKAPKI